MLKKKTEKKILVRLELQPEDHQKLRVKAAKKGVPMSQYAREVVEKDVRKVKEE